MTDFSKFAVIKTGWCDSYTGEEPLGNFSYFDEGIGAERFNMHPAENGFEVYCITPAPKPEILEGWTIAHVAIDPAERKMKLVGWYENASFLGREVPRQGALAGRESLYCIVAEKAFEILPADRPTLVHDRKLGSTRIGWLEGEPTNTDWSAVRRRLKKMIKSVDSSAIDQSSHQPGTGQAKVGDTSRLARTAEGIIVDDGGDVYGKSPGGESDAHRGLREWAYANGAHFTKLFEFNDDDDVNFMAATEYPLLSGDRIDAAHIGKRHAALIEAKSVRSGEKDVERGIFQCVKYREVFLAMNSNYSRKNVRAILLTQKKVSSRLTALAARLSVHLMRQPKKV